ncbi:hypothetical protein EHF33_14440 [Deinococcus psychrotolerans]|uniref:Double-GTPase 2 domain-containing protein n=1 Tax=Deinococcus psychrotolerans TaxID=2489213 RepID=A0A3G8YFJ7_9DEIO|nr:GTPase domain-containing protein [Deinococcus psychrotolerans]AZI44109.1 hypothetical protein EHF33_14440 [Deinococcus psychrotolerans]
MRGLALEACPTYAPALKRAMKAQPQIGLPEDGVLYPTWTGHTLTPHTARMLQGGTRPIVIALAGLPDAGKTSFLTSLYDRIRREPLGGRDFAGSYTLNGWAELARFLTWQGPVPPAYPPRTSGDRREPGYLHLAFRGQDDRLLDLLIADTPGEWFKEWAQDASAEAAQGARDTLRHADGILLCIDPTQLSGPQRLIARGTLQRLAGRLANAERHGPPAKLVAVYTKSDAIPVGTQRRQEIQDVMDALESRFPNHSSFETVSTFEQGSEAGTGVLESVAAILEAILAPRVHVSASGDREARLARFIKEGA